MREFFFKYKWDNYPPRITAFLSKIRSYFQSKFPFWKHIVRFYGSLPIFGNGQKPICKLTIQTFTQCLRCNLNLLLLSFGKVCYLEESWKENFRSEFAHVRCFVRVWRITRDARQCVCVAWQKYQHKSHARTDIFSVNWADFNLETDRSENEKSND
jgi:hypothetical protein